MRTVTVTLTLPIDEAEAAAADDWQNAKTLVVIQRVRDKKRIVNQLRLACQQSNRALIQFQ